MSDVNWFSVGSTGEYVLDVVESAIDGSISDQEFANKLYAIGLSDKEIMRVFISEVMGL